MISYVMLDLLLVGSSFYKQCLEWRVEMLLLTTVLYSIKLVFSIFREIIKKLIQPKIQSSKFCYPEVIQITEHNTKFHNAFWSCKFVTNDKNYTKKRNKLIKNMLHSSFKLRILGIWSRNKTITNYFSF